MSTEVRREDRMEESKQEHVAQTDKTATSEVDNAQSALYRKMSELVDRLGGAAIGASVGALLSIGAVVTTPLGVCVAVGASIGVLHMEIIAGFRAICTAVGATVGYAVGGVAFGIIFIGPIVNDYCKSAWLHTKTAYYNMRAKVSSWF